MRVITEPIEREALRRVVEAFYLAGREDSLLGPVFAGHIQDWEPHMERMTDFWASLVIRESTYSGHVFRMHRAIPGLTGAMFDRWVEIFSAAARAQFGEGPTAELLIDLARRMGVQLQRITAAK